MKKLLLTFSIAVFSILLFGQNENPFSQFGYEAPIMPNKDKKIEKNKLLIIPNMDTTSQFAFIAIDVSKKAICFYDWQDQLIFVDSLKYYLMARWLTPDPAGQYYSPYLGMGNNPINGIDPDGAFWEELGNWFSGNGWKSNDAVAFANAYPDWTWDNNANHFYKMYNDGDMSNNILNSVGISPTFGPVKDFWNPFSTAADYTVMFPIDFAGGVYDFTSNYSDMREANWVNSDKYFHSKANFQATHRGPGGEYAAIKLSNLREIIDQRIKGDSRQDALADQAANMYGRNQAHHYKGVKIKNINYQQAIPKYRPALLPLQY